MGPEKKLSRTKQLSGEDKGATAPPYRKSARTRHRSRTRTVSEDVRTTEEIVEQSVQATNPSIEDSEEHDVNLDIESILEQDEEFERIQKETKQKTPLMTPVPQAGSSAPPIIAPFLRRQDDVPLHRRKRTHSDSESDTPEYADDGEDDHEKGELLSEVQQIKDLLKTVVKNQARILNHMEGLMTRVQTMEEGRRITALDRPPTYIPLDSRAPAGHTPMASNTLLTAGAVTVSSTESGTILYTF